MKRFKTVKVGITFFLDYDQTVEIIKKRRRSAEELTDRYCCIYLDGLGIDDIWDYFESAILHTEEPSTTTEIIED